MFRIVIVGLSCWLIRCGLFVMVRVVLVFFCFVSRFRIMFVVMVVRYVILLLLVSRCWCFVEVGVFGVCL